jgi:predicted dehydrogenase
LEGAEELTQIACDKGVKAMAPLQAQPSSIVQKIKEIVASNDIGKIVSTTVTANFSAYRGGRPAIMEQAAYFADAKTGGNVLTIDFEH